MAVPAPEEFSLTRMISAFDEVREAVATNGAVPDEAFLRGMDSVCALLSKIGPALAMASSDVSSKVCWSSLRRGCGRIS